VRKLTFFLAAVFSVLFAEKALCRGTTFSIEPESFNSLRYEEMRVEGPIERSIRTGRFLSVDPTWSSADLGRPQSWNRYSYVTNDPINRFDPDGRAGERVVKAIRSGADLLEAVPNQPALHVVGSAMRDFADYAESSGDLQNHVLGNATLSNGSLKIALKTNFASGAKLAMLILPVVAEGGAAESETLSRLGKSRESATRLARKAAEAEEAIGVHGVSVTAGTPTGEASSAARVEVESAFKVRNTPTRADPLHRTVELPKPVTKAIADVFNAIFGR
jgi:hypothetical protein